MFHRTANTVFLYWPPACLSASIQQGGKMVDTAKIAKAIVYLRKRAGYTQKDLADRLGVSDKAVSKWERGLGLPDISFLRKLSILLDTDTDSLLAGDVIHHDSGWCGVLYLDKNPYGIGLHTIIYDKPLVCFLLGYFLLVGIRKIIIIVSEEEKAFIHSEFGNGHDWGIDLVCSDSISDTPNIIHTMFSECSNCMIVYGRSLIYGVDQTRFFQKAMHNKNRLTVLSLPRGNKAALQRLCFDDNRKIICDGVSDEVATQYEYYDIPVVFCPAPLITPVFDAIEKGSITENSILKDQHLYTEVLDRGFVEIQIDSWDDVADASGFIRIVQNACGMNLYCLEEIAWRRGMISSEKLKELAKRKNNGQVRSYLESLASAAEEN